MPRSLRVSDRLSREEWLERAMQLLAETGGSRITIDSLVARLGVTKGSFYWHFQDRAEFIRSLVDYWDRRYTRVVTETLGESTAPASERLLLLMEAVISKELVKYELPVRSWATHEPDVARLVRKVDRFRLQFVRSLLAETGFEGQELEIRSRVFVTFVSLETALFDRLPRKERQAQVRARHAFLVHSQVRS